VVSPVRLHSRCHRSLLRADQDGVRLDAKEQLRWYKPGHQAGPANSLSQGQHKSLNMSECLVLLNCMLLQAGLQCCIKTRPRLSLVTCR